MRKVLLEQPTVSSHCAHPGRVSLENARFMSRIIAGGVSELCDKRRKSGHDPDGNDFFERLQCFGRRHVLSIIGPEISSFAV